MIEQKYLNTLKKIRKEILPDSKVFLFGSSLQDKQFRDLDIGVLDPKNEQDLILFRERLEDSTLPYLLDVVDFATVSDDFKKKVFNHKIQWL